LDRASYHDACNDLTVAIGSVRAFLDGKLAASRGNLYDVLQSLEHLDALMVQAQVARPPLRSQCEDGKSQHVAMMSHEFRTLIAAIAGAVELLDRGTLDERQRLHVETISESAEALLGLINRIGDFSQTAVGAGEVVEPIVIAGATRLQLTGVAVLVAEDNTTLQRLLKLQFNELGVQADFASDGQKAIDAVARGSYSMIFMDCQMPNIDGLTAARTIRAQEFTGGTHLPIVAMTANAFDETRAACIEAGMDGYLAKPVRLADLRGALERWSPGALP
jgi:CheY-like chemotaxis protein